MVEHLLLVPNKHTDTLYWPAGYVGSTPGSGQPCKQDCSSVVEHLLLVPNKHTDTLYWPAGYVALLPVQVSRVNRTVAQW